MGIAIPAHRITVAHKNIPNMLGQISTTLAAKGVNIANMINKSRNDYAYTMIDVENPINTDIANDIKTIHGVLKVRVI
jgi:D-3-phosphoglycerate dehydrogenase